MSEGLKVKRSYAIPENEMVIIKDTNTLLHNIVDSEVKEKDREIERLHSIIKEVREYIWSTKYEYGDLEEDNEDFDIDVYKLLEILDKEKE